jgi:hypothetical protein
LPPSLNRSASAFKTVIVIGDVVPVTALRQERPVDNVTVSGSKPSQSYGLGVCYQLEAISIGYTAQWKPTRS